MMTKIFGAVLIVSGGYLLGKVRTNQMRKRHRILQTITKNFREFDAQLREYRRSLQEFSADRVDLLYLTEDKALLQEERTEIEDAIKKMQVASFRESVEVSASILKYLEHQCKKLEEDIATTGKALPLVTGALGLLVAVLLF